MGINYVGRDGSTFSLGWRDQLFAARLLDRLGADAGRWRATPRGQYAGAKASRRWGRLIRLVVVAGLVTVQVHESPDGTRSLREPLVAGAAPASPSSPLARVDAFLGCSLPVGQPQPLAAEDQAWLLGLADFLGGCRACWMR